LNKQQINMKFSRSFWLSLGLSLFASQIPAQILVPYSSFGGGDGWLSPGEGGYTFLGTGSLERGLAYGNGHLYLVSRNGGSFIRILNQTTGADLGSLSTSGVSGGTFAVNAVAVGGDGAIYVDNLTIQSTTTAFKVYRWATEVATPTVAYTGDSGLAGSRVGDSFAAIGSGSSTLLAAGYGSAPAVAGNNSFSVINPTTATASAITFSGSPPAAGDFRLGITFVDSTRVLGTQGSSLYRNTSFSGTVGTLNSSPLIPDPAGATADRLLAYTVLGGKSLLAVQSIGDSHVSIYDASDPSTPLFLASGNTTSGTLTANSNGSGQIAWGAVTDNGNGTFSEVLYAMSSNQGIQAFLITVPEPGSMSLVLMGLGALVLSRKLRKSR
jgi:hypothetical protein